MSRPNVTHEKSPALPSFLILLVCSARPAHEHDAAIYQLRRSPGGVLVAIARSNSQILRDKIQRLIHAALGLTQEALLRQLNPLLRGWANYYRNGAAKRTFDKLEYYVHHKLWRWATRRHPHKPQAWKKRKYFSAAGKVGGFSVKVHRATGESRVLKLYSMASTKIERHIKVRGAANPYDSRYIEYFAQRQCFAWRVLGGGPHASVASTPSG